MKRILTASLVAPLTVPLLFWAISLVEALSDPSRRPWAGRSLITGFAAVMAIGSPIAYGATFIGGLPALWIVRQFAPLTLPRTVSIGALTGLATAILIAPSLRGELVSVPLPAWQGLVLGGAAAAVWHRLALAKAVLRTSGAERGES